MRWNSGSVVGKVGAAMPETVAPATGVVKHPDKHGICDAEAERFAHGTAYCAEHGRFGLWAFLVSIGCAGALGVAVSTKAWGWAAFFAILLLSP